MKVQIDLTLKTIKLESNVNFGEFVEKMQQMIPDWKEYSISTNTTIQWKEYPVWVYKPYERHNWWLTTAGNTAPALTTLYNSSSGVTLTNNSNSPLELKAPITTGDILNEWKKSELENKTNILNVEL